MMFFVIISVYVFPLYVLNFFSTRDMEVPLVVRGQVEGLLLCVSRSGTPVVGLLYGVAC